MGDKKRITGYLMAEYLIQSTVAANAAKERLHETLIQNRTQTLIKIVKAAIIDILNAAYTEPEDYIAPLGKLLDVLEEAESGNFDNEVIGYLLRDLTRVDIGLTSAREVMEANGYIEQQIDVVAAAEKAVKEIKSLVNQG